MLKKNNIICAAPRCQNKLSWRCSYGFGGSVRAMPCVVGVCGRHAKEMFLSDETKFISMRNDEGLNYDSETDCESDSSSDGSDSEFETERCISEDEQSDVQEQCVIFTDILNEEDVVCTNLTDATFADGKDNFGGHFLIQGLISMSNKAVFDNKVSLKWNNFLTYVHSIVGEKLLPLLYVEALLFPNIFWALDNGAPVGALPSIFYTEFGKNAIPIGFASWEDHMTVRVSDHTLLTARDQSYLSFMFDCHMNMMLNHDSSAIAMKKGFEYITSGAMAVDDSEYRIAFDEIDSRKQISRLSSMMKDFPWSMFVTITCNTSSTMGIRRIRKALEDKYGKNTPELHIALQNYTAIFCKAWVKVIKMFFKYLVASKEDVLGDVVSFWLRFEFQSAGAPGNLPHVHAGLSLSKNSRYTREDLCRKVHNKITQIFSEGNGTDFESLLKKGVVKDFNEFVSMYELAEKLFVHDCFKARYTCGKERSDGSKHCRVPFYKPGFEPSEKVWDSIFDLNFLKLLSEINLAECLNVNGETKFVVDESLRCSTWNYPTEPGLRSVPTNGILFSLFRSMTNVQVCSRKFMSSYLAKYVAKVNEMKEVHLGCDDSSNVNVRRNDATYDAGKSDASKASNAGAKKGSATRDKRESSSYREVGLAEMIWKLHKLPYILSNVEFVHYSTHAPEHRYCVKNTFRKNKKQTTDIRDLKVVAQRHHLPSWRQFSQNQLLMIQQLDSSNFYVDRTTSFSIRPPELLFINKVELYLKFFTFDSGKFNLKEDLWDSPFIDGMNRRVRVRIVYLFAVRDMLNQLPNHQSESTLMLLSIFNSLCEEVNQSALSERFHTFVDSSAVKEVVPVMSNIDVNVPGKFLIHLLISMGKFETEHGLYTEESLYNAFVKAGIVDNSVSPYDNWCRLCETYVREQLLYFPLSTQSFMHKLSSAASTLKTFLNGGTIDYSMPICMERIMKDVAVDAVKAMARKKRSHILGAIVQQNFTGCPSIDLMENNEVFLYYPVLLKLATQSSGSFLEQVLAKERLVSTIDDYCSSRCTAVRFPLLMGPPGAGKTYILLMACLYAISKGLVCAVTAITGERSRMLGGDHLHSMFGFSGRSGSRSIANISAANCLASLASNAPQLAYLKTIDVLCIEEIGLVPGHILNVIDYVLRTIRNSSKPYGGILILASGDHKQLTPVEGQTVWTSVERMIQFQILLLKHYVRCQSDSELEKILSIFRIPNPSSDDIDYVCDTISRRCASNVVQSWDAVPEKYFRIVGKVEATLSIINRYVEGRMQREKYFVSIAQDEMKDTANVWIRASSYTKKRMNKLFREPYKLVFFVKSVMCLTFNCKKFDNKGNSFSQGQLVVVLQIPSEDHDVMSRYVKVKLVPPGERHVDVENLPTVWPELKIKPRTTATKRIMHSYSYVRRIQWPLKPYVCNTIHKCIGETILFVATQISCDGQYAVWDRNQVLVLLSRVPSLSNLMFVGQLGDNLATIRHVLSNVDSLEQSADNIVEKCNVLRDGDRFIMPSLYSPSMTIELPSVPCGYVYMIVSQKFGEYRIKECEDLRKELKKVNNILALDNDRHFQPWLLVCYIFGFRQDAKHSDNIKGRCEVRDSWVENVIQLNISKCENALSCLFSLYQNWVKNEILKDIIIRQVMNFKKPAPPNFVPIALSDSNGYPENCIDIGSSSNLERLPSNVTITVNDNNVEVCNEPAITCSEISYENEVCSVDDAHQREREVIPSLTAVDTLVTETECNQSMSLVDVEAQRLVGNDAIELEILDSDCESVEIVIDFDSTSKRLKKDENRWNWSRADTWSNGHVLSLDSAFSLLEHVIAVQDDGHSLFYSIAESMYAQYSYNLEVSRLVNICRCEFLGNRDKYVFACGVVESESLANEYLNLKRFNNEFADMAPYMLANALKIKIKILEKLSVNRVRYACVEPRDGVQCMGSVYVLKEGLHYNALNKILMSPMVHGHHLDQDLSERVLGLVIPVEGDGHCLFRAIAKSMHAQYELSVEASRLVSVCRQEFNVNKRYYAVEHDVAQLSGFLEEYLTLKRLQNSISDLPPLIMASGLQVQLVLMNRMSDGTLKVLNIVPRVEYPLQRKIYIHKEDFLYSGLRMTAPETTHSYCSATSLQKANAVSTTA